LTRRVSYRSRIIAGIVASIILAGAAGSAIALASSRGAGSPYAGLRLGSLPAKKAAILRRLEARQRAAALHPAPKVAIRPVPSHVPPRVSSIQVLHQSPLGAATLGVNDVWQGRVGRIWVVAYAGTYRKSGTGAGSPAIVLYAEPINPNAVNQFFRPLGIFQAPGTERTVTIVRAYGDVLYLRRQGSRWLTFNVATRTYAV
jgi:hypothetical protein